MKQMNLKHILIGVFLAPLSFSHSVNAQTSPSVISFEELNSPARSPEILPIAQNEREYQLEILEQALGVANTLEDLSERVHLFSEIAIEYADFGQVNRALEIFLTAQELANTIEDPQQRNILLSELALKEAELQPRDIALQRLTTALDIANDIEDLQKRTRLLSQIALKLTKLGESDRAAAILAKRKI
jgi:tetratricopeptide (TPR) repeat protein